MDFNEDLNKIEAEIKDKISPEQKEKIKVEAKANAEAREISTIAQDTNKTLDTKLNMALTEFVDTDETVKEQIKVTAGKLVETGLKKQEHKVSKEKKEAQRDENKADFYLDEDTYRAFGQTIAPTEAWKRKFIKAMANFWFVVISIICFVSLAPFYMYVKVIKSQSNLLKWVAGFVGVLLLLGCLAGITYACLDWSGLLALKYALT